MPHTNPTDEQIKQLLASTNTIAIVGASANPEKASYDIMRRLLKVGYKVVPVNPRESDVLGQRSFPSLSDIPDAIDIVNVFRRAEETPAIADEAVSIGARALWLQTGIANEEAAERAEANGLMVVMDACLATAHSLLRVPWKNAP